MGDRRVHRGSSSLNDLPLMRSFPCNRHGHLDEPIYERKGADYTPDSGSDDTYVIQTSFTPTSFASYPQDHFAKTEFSSLEEANEVSRQNLS